MINKEVVCPIFPKEKGSWTAPLPMAGVDIKKTLFGGFFSGFISPTTG